MKPWVQSLVLEKPGIIVHVYDPSTWEAEAEVQGHPWLYSEFTTSLDYMSISRKKKKTGGGVGNIPFLRREGRIKNGWKRIGKLKQVGEKTIKGKRMRVKERMRGKERALK